MCSGRSRMVAAQRERTRGRFGAMLARYDRKFKQAMARASEREYNQRNGSTSGNLPDHLGRS